MSGEPLMCVWQAVEAINNSPNQSYVSPATLKEVVENLGKVDGVHYSKTRFEEVFKDKKVEFTSFKEYAKNSLCPPGELFHSFTSNIEDKCWQISMDKYRSDALNSEDIYKMWTIFNRLCDEDSYPATMLKEQSIYIFSRIATAIRKPWKGGASLPENGFQFQEMIDTLDSMYFSVTSTLTVRQGIEDIYTWLVREVMKAGWLQKRTRKNSNWTNWLKRWVIMTPGKIEYFENCKQKGKKREVIISARSLVDGMADYKSFLNKMGHRFRVTNAPSFEIEFCADSQLEKESWLHQLNINVQSIRTGVTPQMLLLKEHARTRLIRNADTDQSERQLEAAQKLARAGSRIYDGQTNSDDDNYETITHEPTVEDCDSACKIETEKLRKMFHDFDKDGNGRIDRKEFSSFVLKLGTKLQQREIDLIFKNVDKDQDEFIAFEEFMSYFMNCVLENSTDKVSEANLRAAFLQADRDGSGTINFREFYEFVSSVRQSLVLEDITEQFQEMLNKENTEVINFCEFKKLFEQESNIIDKKLILRDSQNVEKMLRKVYQETDVSQLMSYLRKRWEVFASFKRYGEAGHVVMKGESGIVTDFVPGNYTLLDLACFNDLPAVTPKKRSVKVKWSLMDNSGHSKSENVIFPDDFDGEIPTEIATNEHLAYYGCNLADGNQLKISLLYRHGVQDFTYENDYLEEYVKSEKCSGGAGIESHDFAHLDCPFEDNSGYFVIGKLEGEILHLTGFKVPTRHTIYVPGGVIHSNDYLRGTWRTMLSDEADIKHSYIVRNDRGKLSHFTFKFLPLAI